MVNLIYRHYQEGDEVQLADLFIRSFQMNGGGFSRTPKSWHWRYVQSPGFEPEQCQIAEDSDTHKLVGAIYVNLVETIPLNGKTYLTGEINDVSCHPDYTGRGISKKLMDMAIRYMERKKCDISMLTADYNGFPRKKIYLKYGYVDVDRSYIFFYISNPLKLFRDMPAIGIFLPPFLFLSYLPRILNRLRIRFNPHFKEISYEIVHNRKHFEYMEAANRIIPKYFTGFPGYTKERIIWGRIKTPAKRFEPTYIMIKKKNNIIGGAFFTYSNIYAFKYGIKIRVGVLHEFFLDKAEFNTKRDLHFGYILLLEKVIKAADKQKIAGLFYQGPSLDKSMYQGFRGMNFFAVKGGVAMIKIINKELRLPKLTKPLYIGTWVNKGIP